VTPTPRQSTWVATLIVLLVGAIVVTALAVYNVEDFLKVWAVIGTLVGLVTGAIPGFFFASSAQRNAQASAQLSQQADAKLQTVLGLAPPDVLRSAQGMRPDLFGAASGAKGQPSADAAP
jgi:predicted lipid-binding transport protein (Tim44 family)